MELKEIQNLIKFVAKTGVSEVQLELGDVKLTIKTQDGVVHGTSVACRAMKSVSKKL